MVGDRGRRGRRLTLAPSTVSSLRPKPVSTIQEDDQHKERRCREGRAALSRMVQRVVEVTPRPKPVHAIPIRSKFWVQEGDGDESEDEGTNSPSTPVFMKQALEVGFLVDQLLRAKKALSSGNMSPVLDDLLLSQTIVQKLLSRKIPLIPWSGPLPEPRISPPRTLGDCIAATLPKSSSSSSIQLW